MHTRHACASEETKILDRHGNTIDVINEFFISGTKKAVDKIFRLGNSTIVYPENFVNIDFDKFEGFGLKAFDAATISRINDTELKYVFNFLENHLSKGDKFVIKLESVLYSCTSCQRYLLSMQKYAKSQGKIIEIEFISNTRVTSIPKLNNTLGL